MHSIDIVNVGLYGRDRIAYHPNLPGVPRCYGQRGRVGVCVYLFKELRQRCALLGRPVGSGSRLFLVGLFLLVRLFLDHDFHVISLGGGVGWGQGG